MRYTVELDGRQGIRQDEEALVLKFEDGREEHMRLHEYSRVYDIPGLYEEVVQKRLECASPKTLADALVQETTKAGVPPSDLRVLDLGAGNGVVGDELRGHGVEVLIGQDNIEEARTAAFRDRPGLYGEYLVGDLQTLPAIDDLTESMQLNCLVGAGALGLGHISAETFDRTWQRFRPGSWFAVTVAESLVTPASEFGDYLQDLRRSSTTRLCVQERFRHRLTMSGTPIYYFVVVGTKVALG